MEEAAKNVLKAGISRPFIYNVTSKDIQHPVGRLIGTAHYCNSSMVANQALVDASSRCSLFFMERLPIWYGKADTTSCVGGIFCCPFSDNLLARKGLNVMMDSTLCLRASSNGIECRGLESFEDCETRGQWFKELPQFGFDQSGNEYRISVQCSQEKHHLLSKGSLSYLTNRSDEEIAIEGTEFYQMGSANQLFNIMMIGHGNLDEAIFKPSAIWAKRSIIPAFQSIREGELPVCVAVGVTHLCSRSSEKEQVGLINILRNHGFDVKRA